MVKRVPAAVGAEVGAVVAGEGRTIGIGGKEIIDNHNHRLQFFQTDFFSN